MAERQYQCVSQFRAFTTIGDKEENSLEELTMFTVFTPNFLILLGKKLSRVPATLCKITFLKPMITSTDLLVLW